MANNLIETHPPFHILFKFTASVFVYKSAQGGQTAVLVPNINNSNLYDQHTLSTKLTKVIVVYDVDFHADDSRLLLLTPSSNKVLRQRDPDISPWIYSLDMFPPGHFPLEQFPLLFYTV